jgi:hypothetical protein
VRRSPGNHFSIKQSCLEFPNPVVNRLKWLSWWHIAGLYCGPRVKLSMKVFARLAGSNVVPVCTENLV